MEKKRVGVYQRLYDYEVQPERHRKYKIMADYLNKHNEDLRYEKSYFDSGKKGYIGCRNLLVDIFTEKIDTLLIIGGMYQLHLDYEIEEKIKQNVEVIELY